MSEVQGRKVTTAIITLLRAECPFPVGDGEAPQEVIENGVTHRSYVVVSRSATWRYMGADYTGQRGSMEELQYQVTGVGLGRDAAEHARDEVLEIMAGIDPNTRTYTYDLTVPGHSVPMRRSGGVLLPQPSGLGTFNAPAYFLVVAARL